MRPGSTERAKEREFKGTFGDGHQKCIRNAEDARAKSDPGNRSKERANGAKNVQEGAHHFREGDNLDAGDFAQSSGGRADLSGVVKADSDGGEAPFTVKHLLGGGERNKKETVITGAATTQNSSDRKVPMSLRTVERIAG